MLAKVHAERIICQGEQFWQIKGFENVKRKDELPNEYLKGALMFHLGSSELEIEGRIPGKENPFPRLTGHGHQFDFNTDELCHTLKLKQILSDAELQWLLTWLRRAGRCLSKINRKLAEQNKDWHGEEEFVI